MKMHLIRTAHTPKLVGLVALSVMFASTSVLAQDIIVDDTSDNTRQDGSWYTSSGKNPYQGRSLYSDSGSKFYWDAVVKLPGDYDVYAWWTYHPNRSNNVPYFVQEPFLAPIQVNVDQRDPKLGGQWNLLGRFSFNNAVTISVASYNGQASADAVKIVRGVTIGPAIWPQVSCVCDEYFSRAVDKYLSWGGTMIPPPYPGGADSVRCDDPNDTDEVRARYETIVDDSTSPPVTISLSLGTDAAGLGRFGECNVFVSRNIPFPPERPSIYRRRAGINSDEQFSFCKASVADYCSSDPVSR